MYNTVLRHFGNIIVTWASILKPIPHLGQAKAQNPSQVMM